MAKNPKERNKKPIVFMCRLGKRPSKKPITLPKIISKINTINPIDNYLWSIVVDGVFSNNL